MLAFDAAKAGDPPPHSPAAGDAQPLDVRTLSAQDQEILRSLKAGMTREEVSRHFVPDGGLSSPTLECYILRGAAVPGHSSQAVMANLSFKPVAMDEATLADPAQRADWFRHHHWFPGVANDTVRTIGAAYLSVVHLD